MMLRQPEPDGCLDLALAGILAGAITQETWPRRLLLAVLSAGLGVAMVVIELLVHH